MENFTPLSALAGGILIGLAAMLMMLNLGRVMGASGIFGAILDNRPGDRLWRGLFVAGMLAGGALVMAQRVDLQNLDVSAPLPVVIVAGLLVGYGTRLGSGCTSGHGVCGLSRLSVRSIVATLTFMATALVVVYLVRHVLGT
jgi:uncharacterized membrane protein YedE/YeeE